jgi:hypothetical protein
MIPTTISHYALPLSESYLLTNWSIISSSSISTNDVDMSQLLPRQFIPEDLHASHSGKVQEIGSDVQKSTIQLIDWDMLSLQWIQSTDRLSYNCGSSSISNSLLERKLLLRGGGTDRTTIYEEEDEKELTNKSSNEHAARYKQQSTKSDEEICKQQQYTRMSWMSPKRIWAAAKTVLGQTSGILRFNRLSSSDKTQEVQSSNDMDFAELDSILEQTNGASASTQTVDDDAWLASDPSPPREASLLKGWNQRSLRTWINKVS